MLKELAEIIDAHGGQAYRDSLDSIEIEMSASGFLPFKFPIFIPLQS